MLAYNSSSSSSSSGIGSSSNSSTRYTPTLNAVRTRTFRSTPMTEDKQHATRFHLWSVFCGAHRFFTKNANALRLVVLQQCFPTTIRCWNTVQTHARTSMNRSIQRLGFSPAQPRRISRLSTERVSRGQEQARRGSVRIYPLSLDSWSLATNRTSWHL